MSELASFFYENGYKNKDEIIAYVSKYVPIPRDRIIELIDLKYIPSIYICDSQIEYGPYFDGSHVMKWIDENFPIKKHRGKKLPQIKIKKYSTPIKEKCLKRHEIPYPLQDMEGNFFTVDYNQICGIYFLVYDGKIVYIGKSINVQKRICEHQKEARKKFNSAFYMPIEESFLDDYELAFIKALKPKYNKHMIDCKIKTNEQKIINEYNLQGVDDEDS